MKSMTGYGRGVSSENGVELTAEVKSVNNRFLDLSVKCPRIFLAEEERIRSTVRRYVTRGHVDVYISFSDKREKEKTYSVDPSVALAYQRAAKRLRELMPDVEDDTSLTFYLRLPEVVRAEESGEADETLIRALDKALEAALVSLTGMREKEGERLKADLLSRVDTIESLTNSIAERAPLVAKEYREKLTERIGEYLTGKVDETRILTDRDICKLDEVGRKLDFLIQEFNRECNTICSKSNDKEVTAFALSMKNEIEKVREQIQNLE